MTITEAQILLNNRIGWEQPPGADYVVSVDNESSGSGRYFQHEHNAVTIGNIHATIELENATDTQLNEYLARFKKQSIIQVLSDVFEGAKIREIKPGSFDTAISQRMAVIILELIISSTRSNQRERITKEFANKLFYDLYGNNSNEKLPNFIGLKGRYEQEIKRLRDLYNMGRSLDTFTMSIGISDEDPILL